GPGGSIGVGRTLHERWGDAEADFRRVYGLDLRDCFADPASGRLIGVRRLSTYLAGMPEDAMVSRPNSGDPYWGASHELAAVTVELLAELAGRTVTLNRPGAGRREAKGPAVPEPGFVTKPDGGTVATGLEGMLAMTTAAPGRVTAPATAPAPVGGGDG